MFSTRDLSNAYTATNRKEQDYRQNIEVCSAGADPALEKFQRSTDQNHTVGIRLLKSDRLGWTH